jgi:pimeloyl-ACP methyl ester carboxylesterase
MVSSLAEIHTPSLVLSGAEDMPRPPAWASELADGLANAKHIRLEGVGHSVILEAPAKAIAEILRFIARPDA